VAAVAYLAFAFLIVLTWHVPSWAHFVPPWLAHAMYPVDKSSLDPLRVIHFLALAALAVRYIPRNWPPLTSNLLRPFLSFFAHVILVEISNTVVMQILVSVGGIALLVAAAWLMTWYREHVQALQKAQIARVAAEVR
jgi:hypothetical protein